MHILRCMGSKLCVQFQRTNLKFHIKIWKPYTAKYSFTDSIYRVWLTKSLTCDVIRLSEPGPRAEENLPGGLCIQRQVLPHRNVSDAVCSHPHRVDPMYGHLTRYTKLRVAHASGIPGTSPRHRFHRKPLVSDPDMHHGTCATHVPWCMSGSLTRDGGENVPGIPGACATRNLTYLARGPWH